MGNFKLILSTILLTTLSGCGGSNQPSVFTPQTPQLSPKTTPQQQDTSKNMPNGSSNNGSTKDNASGGSNNPGGNNPGGNNPGGNNPGGNNPGGNNPPPKPLELGGISVTDKNFSRVSKTEGDLSKLVVTIQGNPVSIEMLRTASQDKKGAPTLDKDYITNKSYQTFAVSSNNYKAQVYGFLYNKFDGNKGDGTVSAFSVGFITPMNDAVLNPTSKDSLVYKGESFIGNNRTDILKGTSEFKVSFFDKKIEGKLTFVNGPRLDSGFNETTRFPDTVSFTGNIHSNTFKAEGQNARLSFNEKITAEGRFYGEGAQELGGVFNIDDNSKTSGSFGAIKQ